MTRGDCVHDVSLRLHCGECAEERARELYAARLSERVARAMVTELEVENLRVCRLNDHLMTSPPPSKRVLELEAELAERRKVIDAAEQRVLELEAERVEMMRVVRCVASQWVVSDVDSDNYVCFFCGEEDNEEAQLQHEDDCVHVAARRIVAAATGGEDG